MRRDPAISGTVAGPRLCAGAMAAVLMSLSLSLSAHAAGGIEVELNKTEARGDACRVYMVFTNATAAALDSYKPDLVFFDKDGVIAARLVVEGGPLPAGKTKVKLFDVAKTPCTGIGRVLLNDVAACAGPATTEQDCLKATSTSSRADIDFIK